MCDSPRIFCLLLYKDFLVRKRHLKLGLLEILLPIILFITIWGVRNLVANPPRDFHENITYPVETNRPSLPQGLTLRLYVVPDTYVVTILSDYVQKCLRMGTADCTYLNYKIFAIAIPNVFKIV